jgi:hypothetical protein
LLNPSRLKTARNARARSRSRLYVTLSGELFIDHHDGATGNAKVGRKRPGGWQFFSSHRGARIDAIANQFVDPVTSGFWGGLQLV